VANQAIAAEKAFLDLLGRRVKVVQLVCLGLQALKVMQATLELRG